MAKPRRTDTTFKTAAGRFLREYRLHLGLTGHQAADLVGVGSQAFTDAEARLGAARVAELFRLLALADEGRAHQLQLDAKRKARRAVVPAPEEHQLVVELVEPPQVPAPEEHPANGTSGGGDMAAKVVDMVLAHLRAQGVC